VPPEGSRGRNISVSSRLQHSRGEIEFPEGDAELRARSARAVPKNFRGDFPVPGEFPPSETCLDETLRNVPNYGDIQL
jgi:hypothetical protein